MRKYIYSLVLLLSMCVAGSLTAQPYCKVQTFSIADGLGANTISNLVQSNNGTIWIATWNGLSNYDGYTFRVFRDEPGESQKLSTNRIALIEPDSNDDLWCITYDFKVYLFNSDSCYFVNADELLKSQYACDYKAYNAFPLKNGYTWLTGENNVSFRVKNGGLYDEGGVELFDSQAKCGRIRVNKVMLDKFGQEWVFVKNGTYLYGEEVYLNYGFDFVENVGDETYLASPDSLFAQYDSQTRSVTLLSLPGEVTTITGMVSVADRYIALSTDKGAMLYDSKEREFEVLTDAEGNAGECMMVSVDSKQRLWSFRSGEPVLMTDMEKGVTVELPVELSHSWVTTTAARPIFHEDANGVVWVVSDGGIFSYYDENKECLMPYDLNLYNAGKANPLNRIVKYYSDRQGNLWVTGEHNLTLITFNSHKFFSTNTFESRDTRAVRIDSNQNYWVGIFTGELAIYDIEHNLIGYMTKEGEVTPERERLSHIGIYALYEDSRGRMWAGTKGDGLYMFEKQGERYAVKHYLHTEEWNSLPSDNVYDITEDRFGNIWVGTYGGGVCKLSLDDIELGRFINYGMGGEEVPTASFDKVRRLTVTADGVMIASTTSGLITFDSNITRPEDVRFYYNSRRENDSRSLYASDVMQTYVCRNGKIYVATMGGGLQCVASDNLLSDSLLFDKVEGVDADEGLIQSIIEDSKGYLWLVREGSIDKYDPKRSTCEIYGPNDWQGQIEFTEALVVADDDLMNMVAGTIGGFVTFSPNEIRKSDYKPHIIFSGVLWQGEMNVRPMFNVDELVIPSDKRNTSLYFSAIDFTGNNEVVRYAYKINEIDDEWSYTGQGHGISFNHIPPGDYTLLVRSTNAAGVWQDNEVQLSVVVEPTFWESPWAWVLYIVLLALVIYSIFYMVHLRNIANMEKRMKEKQLSFFTNISHQLRTPLTLISAPVRQVLDNEPLSLNAKRYMEIVDENARLMLNLVDKVIDLKSLQEVNDEVLNNDKEPVAQGPVYVDEVMRPIDLTMNDSGKSLVSILVVEDNEELRYFLATTLAESYIVYQARNGEEGYDIAMERQPDIIITDIMMPVMDGMTMVKKIKATQEICHIPIIVLSARAAMDYKIEGLNEGVDDYITKPFSVSYLKSRVSNLVKQRSMLQDRYMKQVGALNNMGMVQLDMSEITDSDKMFIQNLTAFIERNIGNIDLKVEDVARHIGVSRTVFYVKMKTYFGMSPIDFIRKVRIQNAATMIKDTSLSFSEIAFKVGFADAKYFGRCFKSDTGLTPSEYRKKLKG